MGFDPRIREIWNTARYQLSSQSVHSDSVDISVGKHHIYIYIYIRRFLFSETDFEQCRLGISGIAKIVTKLCITSVLS